jgi:hypothetical protein
MSYRAAAPLLVLALLLSPAPAGAQTCPDFTLDRSPYFGDTHIHTAFSFDAVLLGVEALPGQAYQFAQGQPVTLPPFDTGQTAQLRRPLDFAAVTDHAEFFGEFSVCTDDSLGLAGYDSPLCNDYRQLVTDNQDSSTAIPDNTLDIFINFALPLIQPAPVRNPEICGPAPGSDCTDQVPGIWGEIQSAAQLFNDECDFTTFNGYEWTANTLTAGTTGPTGGNLHRNVIFRGDSVQATPTSYFDAPRVQQLWEALVADCIDGDPDCDALTIPHNSNASAGQMFRPFNSDDGTPLTAEDAAFRASIEPVVEIHQHKGNSECRTGVGNTDELCGFENWDRIGVIDDPIPGQTFPPLSYVRNALKEGLVQEEALGVNPFPLGILGSTDAHQADTGSTHEEDYGKWGHQGAADAVPERLLAVQAGSGIETNPGGLAVVWAEENTRDALFDAIRRREVYGTSGTRPLVRFFGGNLSSGLCRRSEFASEGYLRGVPMGGELGAVRRTRSPRFAVLALQDPGPPGESGTPLQRVQIVKGWVDDAGQAQERVFEVAGDPDNGASVDTDTCQTQGSGFDSLCTVWEDPDFDSGQRAFYYARVVENPVCRWSQQLCVSLFGDVGAACTAGSVPSELSQCCSATGAHERWCADELAELAQQGTECGEPGVPAEIAASCCLGNYVELPQTVQERAWTSPIFYRPESVGRLSGAVSFGGGAGDTLRLNAKIQHFPSAVDLAQDDLEIELRDDDVIWAVTIPAGTLDDSRPGLFKFRDATGSQLNGLRNLTLRIRSNGEGILALTTVPMDLSNADPSAHDVTVRVSAGDWSAEHRRRWQLLGGRLRPRP